MFYLLTSGVAVDWCPSTHQSRVSPTESSSALSSSCRVILGAAAAAVGRIGDKGSGTQMAWIAVCRLAVALIPSALGSLCPGSCVTASALRSLCPGPRVLLAALMLCLLQSPLCCNGEELFHRRDHHDQGKYGRRQSIYTVQTFDDALVSPINGFLTITIALW